MNRVYKVFVFQEVSRT